MSDFKLEFTLKQHTPIIHFQSEQKGATLRATELKPKLDRFLIDKLKMLENKKPKEEYKSWFIGGGKEHLALDYKVKIKQGKNVKYYLPLPMKLNTKKYPTKENKTKEYLRKFLNFDFDFLYPTPFFANADKIKFQYQSNEIDIGKTKQEEIIYALFSEDKIEVTITTFVTELEACINEYKDEFFIGTNFGTRQSKGFGSFLREDISTNEIHTILSKHPHKVFSLGYYRDYKQAFLTIDSFYKYLKMGRREPYDRSLLFQYMCETYNIGWEKKFLKNKFPQIIHGTHKPIVCIEPDEREFRYIRALLGLAEHNEFRPKDGKKQIKIESVKRDEKDKTKAFYQRFKSPITFKVFNNNIYLIYNHSYEALLNKEFNFTLNRKEEQLSIAEEFNMYDFLKFVEKKTQLKEVQI